MKPGQIVSMGPRHRFTLSCLPGECEYCDALREAASIPGTPTRLRPLGDRVLIRKPTPGEKIGSIIIPEKARKPPLEGIVEAIGERVTTLKPGDRVLFGALTGSLLDDPRQVILWEKDVMGVIE